MEKTVVDRNSKIVQKREYQSTYNSKCESEGM